MTHNNSLVIDATEYFARITFRVLNGTRPVDAMRTIAKERFGDGLIKRWVEDGLASVTQPTGEDIRAFGQSCHIPEAFPSVVHLIGGYETNLEDALIENVMAGGDSAARGMLAGMVLGAYEASGGIPETWIKLRAGKEIASLLERLGGYPQRWFG